VTGYFIYTTEKEPINLSCPECPDYNLSCPKAIYNLTCPEEEINLTCPQCPDYELSCPPATAICPSCPSLTCPDPVLEIVENITIIEEVVTDIYGYLKIISQPIMTMIVEEEEVTQNFIIHGDVFVQIDIMLSHGAYPDWGNAFIEIYDENDILIVEKTIPRAQISSSVGWHSIPIWQFTNSSRFEIRIRGFHIYVGVTDTNPYPDGESNLGEEYDIAFKLYYVRE